MAAPRVTFEKSPFTMSAVGMVTRSFEAPAWNRNPPYTKWKKVRFLPLYLGSQTGPPNAAPNSFWRLTARLVAINPRASNLSFRKYSQTDPWYAFAPDRLVYTSKPAPV